MLNFQKLGKLHLSKEDAQLKLRSERIVSNEKTVKALRPK